MQDNLDMELLQTLTAIADTGSFALAAKTVHRTQSAVSMQMKRLEEIVDQPLFEKEGRRSVLTLNGQNLLLYARRILSLQQEAMATFRSPDIQGEVRLGVCDDYVLSHMPEILSRYAQRYPLVHIRLESQSSRKLTDATVQGELDFALVNVVRNDLAYEKLSRESLVWVTSENHLAHEQSPLPLAIENHCLWSAWAQQALDNAGIHYRIGYSVFNLTGVTAIVTAGLAVAVMSRKSVPSSLRILTESDGYPELPDTSIGLVVKPSALSPAAQQLADAMRHHFTTEAVAVAAA